MANLISEAIRQGIAQDLQQRASSEVSEYVSCLSKSQRSCHLEESTGEHGLADSPGSATQASLSDEEIPFDLDLSEDEGLEANQPSFVGLFRPQLFCSLLFKAQTTTRLGCSSSVSDLVSTAVDLTSPLFVEPMVDTETVLIPKLFSDVVQTQ